MSYRDPFEEKTLLNGGKFIMRGVVEYTLHNGIHIEILSTYTYYDGPNGSLFHFSNNSQF